MSKRLFIGVFEREEDTLRAVRASRQRGLKVVDVYGPYGAHGIDTAIGLRPSRLPWIVFLIGFAGAAAKVWFEYWTTAVDWPINVGGKPFNSLPAFVPVTFEVMVFCAGVTAVLAFLIASRLYPGKKAAMPVAGITDNRFAVVLEQTDAAFDAPRVKELFASHNAVYVEEQAGEELG